MGGSNSTASAQVVLDSDSKEFEIKLDKQLGALKEEVLAVSPLIQEGVIATTHSIEDALIMRYSQLSDKMKIRQNIEEVLKSKKFPGTDVIVETAFSMISALNSTNEMEEIARWHQRKLMKRVGERVIGVECHYKVNIIEKDVGTFRRNKETICLIAYKFLAHTLDKEPEAFLDDEEFKHLTF